jgi:SAM-dependent methyltransferase
MANPTKRANVGCGRTSTEGWLNFDNSLSVRFARSRLLLATLQHLRLAGRDSILFAETARAKGIRWANACKRIPVSDESLEVVYSSHLIEHLDPHETEQFLREIHRSLEPGGIIRLAVPDLKRRVESYVRTGDADAFMRSLSMRVSSARDLRDKIRLLFLGDRDHRWMYDAASLKELLARFQFTEAREMSPGETTIPDPASLNLWEREQESIYVEARKAPRPRDVRQGEGVV